MQLSYPVKLEANPGKVAKLDLLLEEWTRLINDRIDAFWPLSKGTLRNTYPPNELR
ncbi:unnamed protein product, partial [marine sediment metagenome]